MRKNYKLLKDLPDTNAGAIAEWMESDNAYRMEKTAWVSPHRYHWLTPGQVTQSPEWFEEVNTEVIKVTNLFMQDNTNRIEVFLDRNVRNVTQHDLIKIKEAIQYVFNHNGETYSPFSNFKIDYDGITVSVGGEEYVSKKELRQIRMDAFIAARQIKIYPNGYTCHHPSNARYIDSVDYLDSIEKK